MNILIAPNAFKNSLTAQESADAIKEGLKRSKLVCSTECFPIADGGDGTGLLIVEKCGGVWHEYDVRDPLGRLIKAPIGFIDNGKTAVIEMADCSGIRLLHPSELAPLKSSSFGLGEMISHSLDREVNRIIIGLGGSATVDGGMGLLSALGVFFLDIHGTPLTPIPQNLLNMTDIDTSGMDQRILNCEFTVLCDVNNPLLGDQGASAIFGPQKGATAADIMLLESALQNLAVIAFKKTGKTMHDIKFGGAAGGTAAALHSFLNADLLNGADHFLKITGFQKSLGNADLLITGEGSLDEQTLKGKGPYAVARLAKDQNIPVIGIAGKVPLESNLGLEKFFDVLMPIGHQPSDLDTAIKFTASNLIRTCTALGNMLSLSKK